MKLRGYQLVIASCLAVELTSIIRVIYLNNFERLKSRLSVIVGFGILFLVYPLLGHLADVYLTRYRTLKVSYVIWTIVSCAAVVYWNVDIVASLVFKYEGFHHHQTAVILLVLFTINVMGLGLFEANAIQFGLDQLLEAPTPKLISFIHRYYWSQNAAGLILYYTVIAGTLATYRKEHLGQNSITIQVVENNLYNFPIELGYILILITNIALTVHIVPSRNITTFRKQVSTHSIISTECLSMLGSTRFPSVAVPSPIGRRIFHLVLTWVRTSMEDHSPPRRWRTPKQSYASYHFSCVCLDTI